MKKRLTLNCPAPSPARHRLSQQEIDALIAQEKEAKEHLEKVSRDCAELCLSIRTKLSMHLKALRKSQRVSLARIAEVLGDGRGAYLGFEEPSIVRSAGADRYPEIFDKYEKALRFMGDAGVDGCVKEGRGRPVLTLEGYIAKYPGVVEDLRAGKTAPEIIANRKVSGATIYKIRKLLK